MKLHLAGISFYTSIFSALFSQEYETVHTKLWLKKEDPQSRYCYLFTNKNMGGQKLLSFPHGDSGFICLFSQNAYHPLVFKIKASGVRFPLGEEWSFLTS